MSEKVVIVAAGRTAIVSLLPAELQSAHLVDH